ncbi:MAG TPA: ABC transporter permease [Phototrophicaceae bacterium]|nr:ABC transporter permease [Phototrophicaceae bacterium]
MATPTVPTTLTPAFPAESEKAGFARDVEVVYGIWLRDVKKFWRERSRLLGGIARPILWLLILGSSLRGVVSNTALTGGKDYTQYIFPGVIALTLIFAAMQSAMSIIWDREFGFLKEVLAAPVSRLSIIIGKILGGATQATLQGIITLCFAPLIGLWPSPLVIVALILAMFCVSFALTALGVVIASRMRSFEGFGTISNFVVMPMYFLSGAIYPTSTAPDWMKPLIAINPLTYSVDAMRQITIGVANFPFVFDAAFLVVFTVVVTAVCIPLFKRE